MGTDPESDPHRDKRLVLHADVSVWVPETLQTSCDLRVFVKNPAEAIAPQDTRAGVRWHGRQRPKRCCLTQCAVRPVAVEVFLVLEQDVPGVLRIPVRAPRANAIAERFVGQCPPRVDPDPAGDVLNGEETRTTTSG